MCYSCIDQSNFAQTMCALTVSCGLAGSFLGYKACENDTSVNYRRDVDRYSIAKYTFGGLAVGVLACLSGVAVHKMLA